MVTSHMNQTYCPGVFGVQNGIDEFRSCRKVVMELPHRLALVVVGERGFDGALLVLDGYADAAPLLGA